VGKKCDASFDALCTLRQHDQSALKYPIVDNVDFGAILALAEPILAEASLLAEWTQDGKLDDTGAEMLLRVGWQWIVLETVLTANGLGPQNRRFAGFDDRVCQAATCLADLAAAVSEDAEWFRYLPSGITTTCLLSLAPGARMGMPHAMFAKRLAVAVELLRKVQSTNPIKEVPGRRRTTVDDANDTRATQTGAAPAQREPATTLAPKRNCAKRSTERGEGRAKLIAALTKHHQYANGGCLNLEPIGNNELAKAAGVSPSTASAFFNDKFQGHTKYKTLCRHVGKLVAALKLLNDEFAPYLLLGAAASELADPKQEDMDTD
jgi:hypothetical protein